jgi:hypothetical protein
MNRMSERETVVKLHFAADCCPCVEKLRTVLPLTVGIRDGAVHLVSTFGSAVISARAELGCIIASSSGAAHLFEDALEVVERHGDAHGEHEDGQPRGEARGGHEVERGGPQERGARP